MQRYGGADSRQIKALVPALHAPGAHGGHVQALHVLAMRARRLIMDDPATNDQFIRVPRNLTRSGSLTNADLLLISAHKRPD